MRKGGKRKGSESFWGLTESQAYVPKINEIIYVHEDGDPSNILHEYHGDGTTALSSLSPRVIGGGDVESVNGQTGVVVIDADDIDDSSTTNKFTDEQGNKILNGTYSKTKSEWEAITVDEGDRVIPNKVIAYVLDDITDDVLYSVMGDGNTDIFSITNRIFPVKQGRTISDLTAIPIDSNYTAVVDVDADVELAFDLTNAPSYGVRIKLLLAVDANVTVSVDGDFINATAGIYEGYNEIIIEWLPELLTHYSSPEHCVKTTVELLAAESVTPDDAEAFYPFTNGVTDESGNGNDLVNTGVIFNDTVVIVEGNSAVFDGNDTTKMILPTKMTAGNEFGICGWIRPDDALGVEGHVFGRSTGGSNMALIYDVTNERFVLKTNAGNKYVPGLANQSNIFWWFYTNGVDEYEMYVNGTYYSHAGLTHNSETELFLGGNSNQAADALICRMDNVRVYDRNLSLAELDDLYDEI